MEENRQLPSPAVDLFVPADRFVSASKLYGQLHRWRLLVGRYSWAMASMLILAVGSTAYLTLKSPPAYKSEARMWLAGKMDLREGRLYTEELINYFGTQAELLRSAAIKERALIKATGTNAQKPFPFPFKVKVSEASKSSILELRAIGPEPASTRAFLNDLMSEYLSFKHEARERTSDRTVASVSAEVKELARELEAQQEKLHAFQSSNNVVFLQEQGNSAGSYLAALDKKLANLQTDLRLLRLLQPEQWVERSSKTGAANESLPDQSMNEEMLASLAGPQLELFKAMQQAQMLKARSNELSRFLRPAHPKIIKLNEEIKTQERLAEISRDAAVKLMTHRRQAVELEIENLERASAEWDTKAIDASRKMADYDRIRQDLQRVQSTHDKLLGVIQTVDVGKKLEQESLGILEPASAAEPVNKMIRNLAIAVAGSLLMGFGLLYCLGMLRDDFLTLTELGNHLSEEVVGQIPAISMKKTKGELGFRALEKQRFEFLEAFRNIRSSLFFMGNGGPKPKTIITTSSVPEEGKSTVALYLAATMARGNSRVLLVDADMRRGSLHKVFGVTASPGLAEVLNRESPSGKAIVETGLENLWLLPAGQAKRNPGELVLSSEWERFLGEAKQQFDCILVDTPPVLATDDVSTLAPKVDGVLFVVRGSFTSARVARAALDTLRQRHVRVLGLIFNRVVSSRYERYYYKHYQRAYQWDDKENRPAKALLGKSRANS